MEIAIIADDKKKELMTEFCFAYCGILSKHNICATSLTGKMISETTGLKVDRLLAGSAGAQQITSRINFNEIDLLLYFGDATDPSSISSAVTDELLHACDLQNVPTATNIATADVLVRALDNGDLDWREFVNPRSAYNQRKKKPLPDLGDLI